jgi:Ni,Fe-hydrogenase III small subunit
MSKDKAPREFHEKIKDIQKEIGHWANNCGGCETCDREFGHKEEPTYDMQTVFEIVNEYAALEAKLAECVAAIQYVMANNDKITGWDKLHDAFYSVKK